LTTVILEAIKRAFSVIDLSNDSEINNVITGQSQLLCVLQSSSDEINRQGLLCANGSQWNSFFENGSEIF